MTEIWYHGTSKQNALAIIDSGVFKANTFFAKYLEDAVVYGGTYVFEIIFEDVVRGPGQYEWQMVKFEEVPISQVRCLRFPAKLENDIVTETIHDMSVLDPIVVTGEVRGSIDEKTLKKYGF